MREDGQLLPLQNLPIRLGPHGTLPAPPPDPLLPAPSASTLRLLLAGCSPGSGSHLDGRWRGP